MPNVSELLLAENVHDPKSPWVVAPSRNGMVSIWGGTVRFREVANNTYWGRSTSAFAVFRLRV